MPKSVQKVTKKGKILGKRSKYGSQPRVADEQGVLRKPNAFKYGPSKKKKGLDGGVEKKKKKKAKILPVKVDGETKMLNLKERKELKTKRREARKQRVKAAKQLKLEMEREAKKKGMVLERVKGRERLKHPLGLAIRPKKIKPGSLVPPLTLEQLAALEGMLGRSATNKQKRKEARRIYYGRMKEEKREKVQAKRLAKLEAKAAEGDDAGAATAAHQDAAEIHIDEEDEE